MFRAKRKDGQGEVKGWLFYRDVKGYKKAFILQDVWPMAGYNDRKIWMFDEIEVIPSTISMKTYQLDKAKEMIYGSFDLEGFGMTKGGDRVRILYTDWMSKSDSDLRTLEQYLKDISVYGVIEMADAEWLLKYKSKKYDAYYYGSIHCGKHGEREIIGKQYDGEV